MLDVEPLMAPAETSRMTLEQLLARLSRRDCVDGILLMGSTGSGVTSPWSDHDVLVVLDDQPVAPRMVNTWVEDRFTEVYCTSGRVLDRLTTGAVYEAHEQRTLVEWLRTGRIACDRSGLLGRAQEYVRVTEPPLPASEGELYAAWRTIGYNVVQMRRYLASPDPLASAAVDIRMLYSLMEVVVHYFTMRGLSWRGEKEALRYLEAYDPGFLSLLLRCMAEADRGRRVEQYAALASRTVAPVGRLWREGLTVVQPGRPWGDEDERPPGAVEEALAFWLSLVAPDE